MSDRNSGSVGGCVKERITHVAVPKLISRELWDVKGVVAVRAYQTEIDGRGSLQLDLKYLVSNVRKLAIVRVCCVAEVAANETMEVSTSPALLITSTVWEGSPN